MYNDISNDEFLRPLLEKINNVTHVHGGGLVVEHVRYLDSNPSHCSQVVKTDKVTVLLSNAWQQCEWNGSFGRGHQSQGPSPWKRVKPFLIKAISADHLSVMEISPYK